MKIQINKIEEEFNKLTRPKKCYGSNIKKYYSVALKNSEKNRYRDVVPYNQYLVELKNNNYINASYLPGMSGSNTYISCQAPLPSTIHDFYNMILDNDVSVIVMLTKLMENSRIKAHCYWPVSTYQLYDIEIRVLSTEEIEEDLILRKIQITRDNEESKIVYQVHYTAWPDMGIPENTSTFNNMINLVRDLHKDNTKLLAHCSAGIGRAGSFLAAYSYIDHYINNQQKSVFDIVNAFRKQRLGMVQRKEQYEFIYRALSDYFDDNTSKQTFEEEVEYEEINDFSSLDKIAYHNVLPLKLSIKVV
eukprot:TRINITY_DN13570_c0_g1_i1.p1 TRINITY_DN13570_c0_g1~~TRINITY_DN13570_c0_g1_i1.p1  ORF type:complete len:304 (-),score=82.84 TRINITY_DN13570_c0_g1_i1:110-1021(-)